ncbi:MAG: KOW domain-containing RNA-binding protein [Desulfocucumaceae bacterium]
MHDNIVLGRLVVSTAGRDRGKYYLVLDEGLENKVSVVDGEIRKIANPKRKSRKHLRSFPEISLEISEKVKAGLKVTDLDVRKALREIIANYT